MQRDATVAVLLVSLWGIGVLFLLWAGADRDWAGVWITAPLWVPLMSIGVLRALAWAARVLRL